MPIKIRKSVRNSIQRARSQRRVATSRPPRQTGRSAGKRGGGMFQQSSEGDTERYLAAIIAPFEDYDPLPKVPDQIGVRTLSFRAKMSTTIAGTTSTPLYGTFVAALTPVYNVWDSVWNTSPTNSVVGSTNVPDMYPLTLASLATSFGGTGGAQNAWDKGIQWEVSPDQLYPSVNNPGPNGDGVFSEARCVSAGLRFTFSGNYTSTDGVLYAAVIPKNAIVPFLYYLQNTTSSGPNDESLVTVTAPRTFSEVLATFGVQAFAAQGGVEVHWVPEDPESVTFTQIGKDCARRKTQLPYAISIPGVGIQNSAELEQLNAIPSIFVWGANINPLASFVVEATGIFEATLAPGLSSFLPSTPSPVDVVGFGKALRAAASLPVSRPSPRNFGGALAQSGAMSQVMGGVKSLVSAGGQMIGRRIGGKLGGMAMGGLTSLLGRLNF